MLSSFNTLQNVKVLHLLKGMLYAVCVCLVVSTESIFADTLFTLRFYFNFKYGGSCFCLIKLDLNITQKCISLY